jgi:biopolymer transport protein TolQ
MMFFFGPDDAGQKSIAFNPIELVFHASVVVQVVTAILAFATLMVWVLFVIKFIQIGRMRGGARDFEKRAKDAGSPAELFEMAGNKSSAGARVVHELYSRVTSTNLERLRAVADRAIVTERQKARWALSPLGSIAASAPFIGLFGTVYGIMDAFRSIGEKGNASLPVVAPAIGEALITTAIGLAAAIPAVIFYNLLDRMVDSFVSELEASASEWVALIAEQRESAIPLVPSRGQSSHPPPRTYVQR